MDTDLQERYRAVLADATRRDEPLRILLGPVAQLWPAARDWPVTPVGPEDRAGDQQGLEATQPGEGGLRVRIFPASTGDPDALPTPVDYTLTVSDGHGEVRQVLLEHDSLEVTYDRATFP